MKKPGGRSLLAGLAISLLIMAPTPGVAATDGALAAAPVADELQIAQDSADRVTGSFARGASIVSFDGQRTSAVSATASIVVNGKAVTAARDLRSGTASWSGGGAALQPDDRDALVALVKALDTHWLEPTRDQQGTLGGHRDLVLRMTMLLAEAPLGLALEPQVAPRPGERTLEKKVDLTGASPAEESCLADVVATTAAGSAERREAIILCQESNEDGIWYFPCNTAYRTVCHDADSHCFLCESLLTGTGSSGCMGECGPGCDGLNIYTYDCADHDQCGRVHGGSLNPWDSECGDEYWEADDDFLWGWPNC
ncbi:MAG TPA: hypothetical protein VFM37_13020 [Pseudonocardiaceae bacterium]|nr:hypothetical protein [Pseudonocardiaceae bacterium]